MKKRSKAAKALDGKTTRPAHETPLATVSANATNNSAAKTVEEPKAPATQIELERRQPTGSSVAALAQASAMASALVLCVAYIAAYAIAEGQLAAWNLGAKTGEIAQAELIRGGLIAAGVGLGFGFVGIAAIACIWLLSVLLVWIAKHLPSWRERFLNHSTSSERRDAPASAFAVPVLVVSLLLIAVALHNWISSTAKERARQQVDFFVVRNDGVEYVVIYSAGGTAWSYVYDRQDGRLCPEIQVHKIDEKFHAVLERLGHLDAPPPKKKGDVCPSPNGG